MILQQKIIRQQNTATAMPSRRGPRPLPLHLLTADLTLLSCLAGWQSAKLGSFGWNQNLVHAAADLVPSLQTVPAEAFHAALVRETLGRLEAMQEGIKLYRAHPYYRRLPDPPVIWAEGATRLLDFGADRSTGGPVALFVPSLVNRHYVLDLSENRSLMRWLAGEGFHPLLIDWGHPGPEEAAFSLTDYIAGRLESMIGQVARLAQRPIILVGYCMGGNLALAGALRNEQRIAGLGLLATPWDFQTDMMTRAQGGLVGLLRPLFMQMIDQAGQLPVDALQTLFLSLDPSLGVRKFGQLARMDQESDAARDFVGMEDWLNDGVPLTAEVAKETLIGWYSDNIMAKGEWKIAGQPVLPQAFNRPVLAAIPGADRIVPPSSASALADALPLCERLSPPSGHIGMVAGPRGPEGLWLPLAHWMEKVWQNP